MSGIAWSLACAVLSLMRIGPWPLSLSSKKSGLGLRRISVHCPAAFLACSLNSQELCRKLDPNYALRLDVPTPEAALAMVTLSYSAP